MVSAMEFLDEHDDEEEERINKFKEVRKGELESKLATPPRTPPAIRVEEETKTVTLATGGGDDNDDQEDPGAVPTAADPAAEQILA
ncbi:hypothetical protein LWI28_023769 [Acer negundo]|uniref:Uncharacterized protein n=1 Tax=Acer negundo TaxID=4023 RepID=A0AAD5JRB4_ACENE|nr:hypothetical protein LWI28_023769 [Acer negundo]